MSDRCAFRQGYDIQRNRQGYELLAQKCVTQASPVHYQVVSILAMSEDSKDDPGYLMNS